MSFLKRLFGRKPKSAREARFAGHFYPEGAQALRDLVEGQISEAEAVEIPGVPRALIVPFAELSYCGPLNATAFKSVQEKLMASTSVALCSSALRIPFQNAAVPTVEVFSSPLGHVWLDDPWLDQLVLREDVRPINEAHDPEPCLELQLPYLQTLKPEIKIAPVLFGDGFVETYTSIFDALFEQEERMVILATELSRDVSLEESLALDAETKEAIETFDDERIRRPHASSRLPLRGLLQAAKGRGFVSKTLGMRHSALVSKDEEAVVGYGAFVLYEPAG